MNKIDDAELHQIVQRVVRQVLEPTPAPVKAAPAPASTPAPARIPEAPMGKVVAIGADHGGFELKEMLKVELRIWGYEFLDVGTNSKEAVDYPDFAHAVAQQVSMARLGAAS